MPEDLIIAGLKALCGRFATDPSDGRFEVAKKTGLSEQYLYQVITGKPMANGNPRSLGKIARGKITKAFPDWLDPPHSALAANLLARYMAADTATQLLIDTALAHSDEPIPASLSPSVRAMVDMARAAIKGELSR